MAKGHRVAERTVTENKGRLTTGDAPVFERRKGLANPIDDCAHMIETMIRNWPKEYELPAGHDVFRLTKKMRAVANELRAPETQQDDFLDLL